MLHEIKNKSKTIDPLIVGFKIYTGKSEEIQVLYKF